MSDITHAVNSIYYATIEHMDFNVSNKEIKFDLTLNENGNKSNHTLRFENVTSFVWIEKPKDRPLYSFPKCDYYELTSIIFKEIRTYTENDWLSQYPMGYNVAIEIWETALLINSTELSIDNQSFSIPK